MKNCRRNNSIVMGAFLLCLLGVSTPQASAEQTRDPLIEILIRKGILTEQEAKEIRAEAKALEEDRQKQVVEQIEKKGAPMPKGLKDVSVGMLAYIDYSSGQRPLSGDREESYNEFRLTRGYLTVKKELTPWLGVRITPDITQDSTGDWKLRLKYLYGEFKADDLGFLTDVKSEVGLGHIPWLDFEEHVNPYRCQGTMPIERAGTLNSADLGIGFMGYLGGRLENADEKIGNHYYDGKWGSWHVGVYNGSGYHASEKNNNKIVDGRLTVRPLPEVLPGLQLSYFGLFGEGNEEYNDDSPDYKVNLGMLSYQHPWFTLTAQYFTTEGNAKGDWVDAGHEALDTEGYSLFGDFKLPVLDKKLSVFGRWDHFDADENNMIADDSAYDLYIGGLAYEVYQHNMVLLTYETTDYEDNFGSAKGEIPDTGNDPGAEKKVQIVYQIDF
jgi:hypothetical protein